ncbi:MAG: TonB-dependent receptor plug domain-containing protein [Gammaproteobacteria bacterium]
MPSINLRGISTEAGSNEVGYYLDELPLAGIRVPLKPDVRAWDIERVEVLRGPQGTLFGEGSMGGTIRTITRDPRFNEWQTQFAMQGSHTESGGFNEGYKGMLNIPLLEDRMALRLTGTKEKTADWGQDTAGSSSDLDSQHIATYRAKLLWRPVDRLAINASYWHYDADFSGGFYATEDLDVSRTVKYHRTCDMGLAV